MNVLRPKDLQERLGISASTLRLWSDTFASVLSPGASKSTTQNGTPAQRRYTDLDLQTLLRVKELLGRNQTYAEILETLQGNHMTSEETVTSRSEPEDGRDIAVLDDHPVMLAFREALAAKDAHIATLQTQLDELKSRPPKPVRFRYAFLNRLLVDDDAPQP